MPPKLLTRTVRAKPQTNPQTKTKQKGKGKSKAKLVVEIPIQDIVLSQEQSFELVKIGVNAAVSQFVFCREFFPSNCYKTRIYDASDPGLTYETFINGTNIPKNLNLNEAGDEIISFNSIVRGTGHRGVEKLMDWLEFGVANAVHDKCLAKLQLSVYRKEVVPEQLVEAFTINFAYKSTGSNPYVQVSASMSDNSGKVINLGYAQDGLRELIVQVMNASRNIRGESAGRKVSMQLLYNENARPKNEYRGFRAASISQILPDDCGLFMGKTHNGLHGLAIKYYAAPAVDARLLKGKTSTAMIRSLNPTASKATIIQDNSQSSLRHNQFSQSDGTQQSTMQWLNEIGHTRGPDDMDTQLMENIGNQTIAFGKPTTFPGPEGFDDKVVEKTSEEEDEVRLERSNAAIVETIATVSATVTHGFNDMEGLCQYMNSNQKDTQKLVDSMKTEGIIKKCSKSSKESFRFVNLDKLRVELFDPSKHIAHTKLFAAPEVDLPGKSQDPTQLTPVARRLHQPLDGSIRGRRSEGSSTQTPSSWRSLHNETLRRSPRGPAQSTPQQSNKRVGEEIPSNASKKRRDALAATSPFSLRSNSSH
ncbi:hypothetical protein NHQ30_001493 [Ciborinia camelliae]|nr:hypothetical protein NHQ30_001493 [Ciborinia camelliae]